MWHYFHLYVRGHGLFTPKLKKKNVSICAVSGLIPASNADGGNVVIDVVVII